MATVSASFTGHGAAVLAGSDQVVPSSPLISSLHIPVIPDGTTLQLNSTVFQQYLGFHDATYGIDHSDADRVVYASVRRRGSGSWAGHDRWYNGFTYSMDISNAPWLEPVGWASDRWCVSKFNSSDPIWLLSASRADENTFLVALSDQFPFPSPPPYLASWWDVAADPIEFTLLTPGVDQITSIEGTFRTSETISGKVPGAQTLAATRPDTAEAMRGTTAGPTSLDGAVPGNEAFNGEIN